MYDFLKREFFEQPTLEVSKNLLGKILLFNQLQGIITETEAYIGYDDPACHAAKGKTKRNQAMFERAGFSYVYMIYGMYFCLNIVTEKKDFPAAVLIRGIKLINVNKILNGPGKLCKELGINKEHNQLDMINNQQFSILNNNVKFPFEATPRIGITKGKENLWRFIVKVK
ncbi:DNA-3-methyladenine glycosylase [Rickettsiales endosymbiont of Trichoplax sp. H2]|uniref:DNA-3-methyladenine glycosylase n=1 Tax=Rickettsiales endosymbiont of Trichoplax sp. H2 TaxID=2021221 RepID=UPI0012B39E41|nr:DNA-3-methyladenine glycosylase [Rickettsiales endosymbiont of Trichoplax sp. H2]MSO13886.1 putative 3-methyladenine DNA glycosylase [Rickettsiales endosymbiont of Trichoplax sp. H2]